MQHQVIRRIVRQLVQKRWALLTLAGVLVVASLVVPKDSDFDRRVHNMIASDSEVLQSFRRLKQSFGGNEIVLAVYRDPNLLDPSGAGIERLAEIGERLERTDGVRSTLSLNKLMGRMIASPTNGFAIRLRKLFEGYTHNHDGTIAVVVCMLQPESASTPPRRETIDAIRAVMKDLPGGLEAGTLTGEPVMLVDGFRFVEQDGHRLSLWSSILMGLTILVCFRSVAWTLISIGVVQMSLLLTRTTMALLGMRLSMVSSMLTAVVTVVGVATVVHLIVRFREGRDAGHGIVRSMFRTTHILLVPVFWACVTDAVGFVSLKSATVGPVGDFGVMMAISCLAVLASVWMLVPGLATLGVRGESDPQQVRGQKLKRALMRFADRVQRHWKPMACLTGILVAFSLWGLRFLDVETDFTRNFRHRSEIVRAYHFVEDNLGGAGVGDILVSAPEKLTWSYLQRIRQFEEKIEAEAGNSGPLQGLTKVLSLADGVLAAAPRLPVHEPPSMSHELLTQSGLMLMKARIPSFYAALHAEDVESEGDYYLRIMFRAREQQTAEQKRALIQRLVELGEETFPKQQPPQVTGFFVLLAFLIDNIVGDQWKTFSIAIAGIGFTMLLAFRSFSLALIALIPNALPVLVVSGLMGWMNWIGWFEFRINMGSAMIAAVSLGLSIDSSIHYIFAFQRARGSGKSVHDSIAAAHGTVGLSMIFATLALIVGFSVLATSNFTPTVYFGTLVSLAMLGGLQGNLVVLPILLRIIYRER